MMFDREIEIAISLAATFWPRNGTAPDRRVRPMRLSEEAAEKLQILEKTLNKLEWNARSYATAQRPWAAATVADAGRAFAERWQAAGRRTNHGHSSHAGIIK